MNFLQKVMSFFNCRKPPTFSELWERLENPSFLITLLETSLLGGTLHIFMFWESGIGHFFEEANMNFSDGEIRFTNQSEFSPEEFGRLKSEITRLDQQRLKHYSSGIKDGVDYCICWGTLQDAREVTANNPQSDSRHGELVLLLKQAVPSV